MVEQVAILRQGLRVHRRICGAGMMQLQEHLEGLRRERSGRHGGHVMELPGHRASGIAEEKECCKSAGWCRA